MSDEINKGIPAAAEVASGKPVATVSAAAPAVAVQPEQQPEHLATEVADAHVGLDPAVPEWPPQRSAAGLPEGERAHGSTGQLFEAKSGRWERVQEQNQPAADVDTSGKPVVNRFDHLTQAEHLGEDQAETNAGGAAGGLPSPTPAHIGPQAPTEVLQHEAPESQEQWRTRSIALVAMYEHGMASNSPRTLAELREIKALLDIE